MPFELPLLQYKVQYHHYLTMHLLPEPDLFRLLRQLTPEQGHDFLNALSTTLSTLSSESTVPASERLIHQPLRSTLTTKQGNLSLFMPVSDTASTSIKTVTAVPSGSINGVINIFSPEGKLLGLLSAAEVTAFRTSLAVMTLFVRCPTSLIKRENIVIFGSGRQAEWHARLALLLTPPGEIRRIVFINRGRQRLESMQQEGSVIPDLKRSRPGLVVDVLAQEGTSDYDERLRSELAASDVIFSCTPSTEPNFPYSYLTTDDNGNKKQRFISLIGSYKPHMKEIDTDTLLSGGGMVYVDSKEACLEESGELIDARIKEDKLVEIGGLFGQLGESGTLAVPDGCNVVLKCVGMGVMDLVIGKKLLDVGCEMGLGTDVDGF